MADEPSPNPPPEKPSLGELWDNRVFRIAVIAILLAVFALLFVWDRNRHGLALGLEGRMCRSDDEHITCLRDWLAIVGGFGAILAAAYTVVLVQKQIRHAIDVADETSKQAERAIRASLVNSNAQTIEWLAKYRSEILKAQQKLGPKEATLITLTHALTSTVLKKILDQTGAGGDPLFTGGVITGHLVLLNENTQKAYETANRYNAGKVTDDDMSEIYYTFKDSATDCAKACDIYANALRAGFTANELQDATLDEIAARTRLANEDARDAFKAG